MKRISLLLVLLAVLAACAEEPGQQSKSAPAWSYDQALSQLRLYPKDPYLQYVVLQLGRREQRLEEASNEIERLTGSGAREAANARAQKVDLFNLFSGALAIQESLQLDTMRGGTSARLPGNLAPIQKTAPGKAAPERKPTVKITELTGPTIKSHPWQQMLAGRKPAISPLARCVPDDFYYVEFRSLSKLLDALDLSADWGSHLFSQASQEARTQLVGEKLKKQLAVETQPLLRPFYNMVVEEAAVTGSDLYVREGSDVTLLFRFKQPTVFKARMNGFLDRAQKSQPDARRSEGSILGVRYVQVSTPDRAVHVFSAYPQENLHLRSNSLAGLTRVLEAIQGKTAAGQPVRRLGDTDELAYVRTLMPAGASEEDGFVYLSDPFIRRLVGPQVKLTEARRLVCYNHLRMMGNAALLYRSEHGKAATSLDELARSGCAPGVFGQGELRCPDGGTYTLSADGMTGHCSHHGHAEGLVPCLEIPLKQVTAEEADEYKAFLDAYNQYWRTYFDPIVLRLQVTPKRLRLETIILPLMDNSVYSALAMGLGGKPEALDALPVPKRNIFSVGFRLRKEELLQQAGIVTATQVPDGTKASSGGNAIDRARCSNNLKQIGLALHNYHDVYSKFPAVASFDKNNKPLLSWRVHLLPYLDQEALYKEFRLDEPWDSEHNKKLVARMPAVFRCPVSRTAPGQTTYLAPVGKETMFSGENKPLRMADVFDGSSNTIFVVDADDKNAVPWTKPADLAYDSRKPWSGLIGHHGESCVALFVDGSVHVLTPKIPPERLHALFTRAGGEELTLQPGDELTEQPGRSLFLGLFGPTGQQLDQTRYADFLSRGLGNQVGLHIYDALPIFDFNLAGSLGMALGSFNGRQGGGRLGGDEPLGLAFLAASLMAPVYVALPVADAKIVDDFLDQLDPLVAREARQRERGGFFEIHGDFCKTATPRGLPARSLSIHIGPITWRMFWARVGNGLYLSNKLFVFDDLAEAATQSAANPDKGPAAHAMIRLRPQNWNLVLPDYRLGWAENDREACLSNIGPLSSMARSLASTMAEAGDPKFVKALHELAHRIYGVHFYCPEGGRYEVAKDGKSVPCSVHGTALAPTQPAAEPGARAPHRHLREFTGMTIALTFLEDGLHAIAIVDRK
jgi:hypothetical protein